MRQRSCEYGSLGPLRSLHLRDFVLVFLCCCGCYCCDGFVIQNPSFVAGSANPPLYTTITTAQAAARTATARFLVIDGLVEDFEIQNRIDQTLTVLSDEYLPCITFKPLTQSMASRLYTHNVQLILVPSSSSSSSSAAADGGGEELASDREELISLSNAIVTTYAAARQANQWAQATTATATTAPAPSLDYNITYVPKNATIQVEWVTTAITGVGRGVAGVPQLRGQSEFVLELQNVDNNNQEGCIRQHRLKRITLRNNNDNNSNKNNDANNVVALDGAVVGETLSALRRTVKTVQASGLLKNSPLAAVAAFPIWNELQNELLQQATTPQPTSAASPTTTSPVQIRIHRDSPNTTTETGTANDMGRLPVVIPGTPEWKEYAQVHDIIQTFCSTGLSVLSQGGSDETSPAADADTDIIALFSGSCEFRTIDQKPLTQNPAKIAKFYHTVASIRQSTFGKWSVQRIRADWKSRAVTIEYVTQNGDVEITGTDRFVLSPDGLIERIEQIELVVGGNKLEQDSIEWFKRLFQAIQASGGEPVWRDLLLPLEMRRISKKNGATTTTAIAPPKLSEASAASVYNILRSLHQDLSSIDALTLPPANSYLAPSLQLRGYLDEVLVRGDAPYRRTVGVALASFRGALGTERVTLASNPRVKTEMMPDGTLRVDLVLRLKLRVAVVAAIAGDTEFPVKVQLVSEYRMNLEGKIVVHRLVETRVNDQLTPSDVVTKWIKGDWDGNESSSSLLSSTQSLLDAAFSWARSGRG